MDMFKRTASLSKPIKAWHVRPTCLLRHPASLTLYTHIYFYITTRRGGFATLCQASAWRHETNCSLCHEH